MPSGVFSEPEEVKDRAVGAGLRRLPLPAAERPLGPIALPDPVRCQERGSSSSPVLCQQLMNGLDKLG